MLPANQVFRRTSQGLCIVPAPGNPLSFHGVRPVPRHALLHGEATDLPSALALVNELRQLIVEKGLAGETPK
jgi:hypothetical protein